MGSASPERWAALLNLVVGLARFKSSIRYLGVACSSTEGGKTPPER